MGFSLPNSYLWGLNNGISPSKQLPKLGGSHRSWKETGSHLWRVTFLGSAEETVTFPTVLGGSLGCHISGNPQETLNYVYIYIYQHLQRGAKWFRFRVSIHHPLGFNCHPFEGAGIYNLIYDILHIISTSWQAVFFRQLSYITQPDPNHLLFSIRCHLPKEFLPQVLCHKATAAALCDLDWQNRTWTWMAGQPNLP